AQALRSAAGASEKDRDAGVGLVDQAWEAAKDCLYREGAVLDLLREEKDVLDALAAPVAGEVAATFQRRFRLAEPALCDAHTRELQERYVRDLIDKADLFAPMAACKQARDAAPSLFPPHAFPGARRHFLTRLFRTVIACVNDVVRQDVRQRLEELR